jgi:hypothetical protein
LGIYNDGLLVGFFVGRGVDGLRVVGRSVGGLRVVGRCVGCVARIIFDADKPESNAPFTVEG